MKVVIAGAGIGGLTAGIACQQKGMDVTIYERAPNLEDIGAGIQISPNAMRVFQKLGLAEAVIDRGFLPEKLETRMGKSGRRLFAIEAQGWDAPYVHVHRADLIRILADRFSNSPKAQLHLGKPYIGDGKDFDIVIGADGIHSKIRERLHGPQNARFTGNIAWRATVPTDKLGELAPAPNATVWMGDKRHCVTYRIRGGKLTNFVGVVETNIESDESWTRQGTLSNLKSDFQNWHPVIENLISNIDEIGLFEWALYDREPLEFWTNDNVTLLGDAAHPVLPFMAQGAAMAVEDAWALATAISENNLAKYEASRLPRTSRILRQSRQNMKTFHRANGLGHLSYLPMWFGGRLAPFVIKRRFNWIYNFDITAPITETTL